MFNFSKISRSANGNTLDGCCSLSADMPFFNGHFPGDPMMPAAAQIEMIQALLHQHSGWNVNIKGGDGLKFSGRITPADELVIRLQHIPGEKISFRVENNNTVTSRGSFRISGEIRD